MSPTGHKENDHKPRATLGRRTVASRRAKNTTSCPALDHYRWDNLAVNRRLEAMTNVFDAEDFMEHRNVWLPEITR